MKLDTDTISLLKLIVIAAGMLPLMIVLLPMMYASSIGTVFDPANLPIWTRFGSMVVVGFVYCYAGSRWMITHLS